MKKDKRILFLINGHGLGNIVRDIEIIKDVNETNEVYVGASGFAYKVLEKDINNFKIYKIRKLNFKISEIISYFKELRTLIKKINPDFILVDSVYPLLRKYKIITIRNPIRITTKMYLKSWLIEILDFLYTEVIAYKKIEMSFVKGSLIGPIFRNEIDALRKNKYEGHPIMIGSGDSYISKDIEKILKEKINYIEHHATSNIINKQFLKDFENSKFTIIRGGFNSISESILLNKPMICIPIEKHYEQHMNANYIEEMNYGIVLRECDTRDQIKHKVDKFLRNTEFYRKEIMKNEIRNSRKDVISKINKLIKDIDS